MKKFLASTMLALIVTIFFPAMTCEAINWRWGRDSVPVTDLKYIVGNWYDGKGNLVLTISNDYKINGCTVLAVKSNYDNKSELYEVVIDEGTGKKNMVLGTEGYTKWLILNLYEPRNEIALRKTKEPRYFESVGGIYLGMDNDDVIKLYGQPSSVQGGALFLSIWKYRGFDVVIRGGIITGITIYSNSDRRFDWSGLSANSSKADFEYKYNNKINSSGTIDIGHGELINIENDRVMLWPKQRWLS